MAFKPGSYKISSATGPVAGRNINEDRSLLPKRVLCPPDEGGVQEAVWRVEHIDGDRYRLLARGAPVTDLDGKLVAILIPEEYKDGLEWNITALPQHGELCIITKVTDPSLGWVAPNEDAEDKQIAVRGLVATKSLPPQYLQSELWSFTPCDEA